MTQALSDQAVTALASAAPGEELHPAYLTREEAAELLRVTPDTMRYWAQVKKGPAFSRRGRRCLYRRVDVIDWIEAGFDEDGSVE